MFARMLVATALVLTSGVALASDVSYDQQQIREGNVTLVEGGLRTAAKAEKVPQLEKAAPASKTGHMVACSCSK
jgi:coenzyme F420-reducing hydrogenase gamma subunit